MGLFGNNKKEEKKKEEVLQLPALPRLPEFPGPEEEVMRIHGLPSFPSSYLGTKFSQNTIKEAVTGDKEGDFSDEDADDFANEDDSRMMQEPLKRPLTEEMGSRRFSPNFSKGMTPGPVFIRVDKFEGAMEVFNETRRKISEIEVALEEIKSIKEKEERELQSWENKIKLMKDQIEKVDRDVFSKV